MQKLKRSVVHYGKHDPRSKVGGVEAFARNLGIVFDEVLFMTPSAADFERVRRERLPVICDNHWVLDIPEDIPAIGFQHGVARVKMRVTHTLKDRAMAWRQRRAASRPNTLWVACAEWIARSFGELHGNRARHVVYHMVDLARFDGRLDNAGSRLVLHDARSEAKGKRAVELLARSLPELRFEALACKPEQVPDRMRKACAFVHLSGYEGNSIVCNEAMASDLPCFFTRVGLMQDADGPNDVVCIDPAWLRNEERLIGAGREFFDSLTTHTYHPRAWVLQHASPEAALHAWETVVTDLDAMWRAR